ncbi:CvpA family protein [Gimibacter soli]|uniref:CvpA family protein n=1 Tax=Gimibacter soli TaxID=3024400 RepID=A0AAE9XUH9_9PROT|nr:CvpA family protein [Gimibacter soli]WCL52974.1 CvpA family protein [Gimibacter soli]
MDLAQLTAFDIGVLLLVGLSTILAFGRGFATVALSFAAWAGAGFVTFFGFPLAKPYGRDIVSPPELADLITLLVIFAVALFILRYIAEFVGRAVKDSPIGFLDRSLGALFGFLRGVVIISVAYLAISKLYPGKDSPPWISNAQLQPLVAWGAEMVEGFAAEAIGEDPRAVGDAYLEKASRSATSQFISETLKEKAASYDDKARDRLDDLIDTVEEDLPPPEPEK